MNSYVLIKEGSYRNQLIKDKVFPLIKNVQDSKAGMFVTVDGTEGFDNPKIRVKIKSPTDVTFVDRGEYASQVEASTPKESSKLNAKDEKRIGEIAQRFEILDEMTTALKNGDVRAMIVTGPPGVGKSYGVETTLEEQSGFDDLAGNRKFEFVKGAMTALGLYAKLYEFSNSGNVVVFDDCDSVLLDDLALNILKAALDSGARRRIYWNADSAKLRAEGIPNHFDFRGSVAFITNIKFDHVKSKKLRDHLDALMSRCHYIDLTLDTERDKYLRIQQIARKGDLFANYKNFSENDKQEILEFMFQKRKFLREMSLRMALKIADLKKLNSSNWKMLAENTCMRRG